MNRRNFTITSFLGSMGLFLSPQFILANSYTTINIGVTNEHIRHGLFNDENFFSFNDLQIEIKRDRFYKNGLTKGSDDFYLITVKYKNEVLLLNKQSPITQLGDYTYEIISAKQTKIIREGIIIPHTRRTFINENLISENEGIIVSDKVEVKSNGSFLHICRNNH